MSHRAPFRLDIADVVIINSDLSAITIIPALAAIPVYPDIAM